MNLKISVEKLISELSTKQEQLSKLSAVEQAQYKKALMKWRNNIAQSLELVATKVRAGQLEITGFYCLRDKFDFPEAPSEPTKKQQLDRISSAIKRLKLASNDFVDEKTSTGFLSLLD